MAAQNDSYAWQETRAFEDTNMHMLDDGTLCDVTFHVGPNKVKIKAHKFILASRSPVFFAMFCGPLSQREYNNIEITDIDPDIMQALLRFMYTEYSPINKETVLPLLYAAKKYNVKRLEGQCQIFLSEQISIENVCTILAHAERYDASELKYTCLKFIASNVSNILLLDDFCALPREVIQQILQMDGLCVNESEVYNGCKKWAVHQLHMVDKNKNVSHVDIRETLGKLLYHIRFPIMSMKDFTTRVSQESVLSPEEKVSIFQYITAGIKSEDFKFSDKPRTQKVIISRFSEFLSGWTHGGSPDVIEFSLSKRSAILGIGLYTSTLKKGKISGSVSLSLKDTLLLKKDVDVLYDEVDKTTEILFDNSVYLEPAMRYSLKVTLEGNTSFYGNRGKHRVVEGDITVSFFENTSITLQNGTSPDRGQIPFLILLSSA
ncbi:hypothetical protein ACF0H5_021610 [Mactra antiquata]